MFEPALIVAQLAGLESWQRAHASFPAPCGTAKEIRLDEERVRAARRRQQETLQARAAMSLAAAPPPVASTDQLRAVVIHPHVYQRRTLVKALTSDGRCVVIADASDGAAAVGLAVIEQPDLVLLSQQMTYMTGFEAAPEIRRYAPRTTIAMQVAGSEYFDVALAAGAHAVFSVGTPLPRLVAEVVGVAAGAAAS